MIKLFPHSRLVLEIRLGRVAALEQALKDDPSLLNKKISQSPYGTTESLLENAVRMDQVNIAQWLISKGASETPATAPALLLYSVMIGNKILAERFTKQGWDPNAALGDPYNLDSPICQAASIGRLDLLKWWGSQKISLNKINPETGNNLLHVSMLGISGQPYEKRLIESTKWLMHKGVSGSLLNNKNETPFDLCRYTNTKDELFDYWEALSSRRVKRAITKEVSTPSALKSRKKI